MTTVKLVALIIDGLLGLLVVTVFLIAEWEDRHQRSERDDPDKEEPA